jgi:hypothetical protein
MTLSVKPGVDISHLDPRWLQVLPIIHSCFALHGSDLTITSGRDGDHKEGSLHYAVPMRALDFRIWHVNDVPALAEALRVALGPDFDVVVEDTHIHIELDPKWIH